MKDLNRVDNSRICDVVCDEKNKIKKIASLDKKDKRKKKGRAEWDSFETHSFIKTPEGVEKKE